MQKILFLRRKKARIFLGVFVFFFLGSFLLAPKTVYSVAPLPVVDFSSNAAILHQTAQQAGIDVKNKVDHRGGLCKIFQESWFIGNFNYDYNLSSYEY